MKNKFQSPSFIDTPMQRSVFTVSTVFSVPSGRLNAWTGKEKVHLLGLCRS